MANYVSNYTGAEVDAILTKANTIPVPTAQDIDKVLAVGANGIEWAEGAGSSSALPKYDFADGGKILAVSSESGEVELVWENNVKIPSTANNNGKVLKVINANGTVGWATESTEIPSYSQADEGKILGISGNVVTWITNSGGNGGGGTTLPEQQDSATEQILITDEHGDLGWKSLENMYITSGSTITDYVDGKISDVRAELPSFSCGVINALDWLSSATTELDYYVQAANNAPSEIDSVLVHDSDGNLKFVDPATLFNN